MMIYTIWDDGDGDGDDDDNDHDKLKTKSLFSSKFIILSHLISSRAHKFSPSSEKKKTLTNSQRQQNFVYHT